MDILIATYQLSSVMELMKTLKEKCILPKVIHFIDINLLVDTLARGEYGLSIIITEDMNFSRSCNIQNIQVTNPIMILAGVQDFNILSLNAIIETFQLKGNQNISKEFNDSLMYIEEHLYDDQLSLDRVASHIFVSKYHYSRMFQKNVGMGFKEYIIKKRIQRAKLLLEQGEAVTETCYSVGYGDLTHFSRIFKRIVGVNPSVYRASTTLRTGNVALEF